MIEYFTGIVYLSLLPRWSNRCVRSSQQRQHSGRLHSTTGQCHHNERSATNTCQQRQRQRWPTWWQERGSRQYFFHRSVGTCNCTTTECSLCFYEW